MKPRWMGHPLCAAAEESRSLHFGRDDRFWVGVEESGRALRDTPPFRKVPRKDGPPEVVVVRAKRRFPPGMTSKKTRAS